MKQSPTVFVVDDDVDRRARLCALVKSTGLEVETYSDVTALLRVLAPERPGCLIVGAGRRGTRRLKSQEEVAARHAPIPVIVMTATADVSAAVKAMKAGAVDVIEERALRRRLVPAVRAAIQADLRSRAAQAGSHDIRLRYARLTRREREVLDLVAEGLTSGAIAARLGLREHTVAVYRSHINRTMRARNVAELIGMLNCIK